MKPKLFESFPQTFPAGISLLRVSVLALLLHPWMPPHDLVPTNRKILFCEAPLGFSGLYNDCLFSVNLPDPRRPISSSCFNPPPRGCVFLVFQPSVDAGHFAQHCMGREASASGRHLSSIPVTCRYCPYNCQWLFLSILPLRLHPLCLRRSRLALSAPSWGRPCC